ncbi:glycosyltransferase family 2 protein [Flavobacterium sp.]|uniref:glycosyltransferase family 2 protein n=1 Tax=Flavobacterium sp. TaxID=239 RepID=UPI0040473C81
MKVASIIIINFNTSELTIQALKSIEKLITNPDSFEIILVDNASNINDFHNLQEVLPKLNKISIKLIRSRINVGFGAGNMLGIQQAIGKYYVFINSDVILEENAIEFLIKFLEKNPNASMVGCQALDENYKKFKGFDYNLSFFTEIFSDKFLHFINSKKYPRRISNSKTPIKVGAVSGSLFCVNASDFNHVGGFDTNIFLYYEEKDLAYRIHKYIKKDIYFLPNVNYIHLCGKSTSPSQKIKNELKISQFYTIKKNLGTFQYFFFFLSQLLIFLIKSPFNKKNRAYLSLLLHGPSVANSLKHSQKII